MAEKNPSLGSNYSHNDSNEGDGSFDSDSGNDSALEDSIISKIGKLKLEDVSTNVDKDHNASDDSNDELQEEKWEVYSNSHPELDKFKSQWATEQLLLKEQLILQDAPEVLAWAKGRDPLKNLKYIGGVDISFVKDDSVNACAMLVVLEYPSLQLIYEDPVMVELTLPYIPSFLAFREAPFLKERLDELKKNKPEIVPQVILVDGNGILHTRGFGLASHFGVLSEIPTIGVAKKLFLVDGLCKGSHHSMLIKTLKKAGDSFPLIGNSGKTWGVAMRGHDFSANPIYVSSGHKISLKTAQTVVFQCCRSRIPEPIRQADLRSREVIRRLHEPKGSRRKHGKKFDRKSSNKQIPTYKTKHGNTKPQIVFDDGEKNPEPNIAIDSDDDYS